LEEVGWDAPGLSESEIVISIAQEFELFGQLGARKRHAQAQVNSTELQIRLVAFDLYLDVKQRFYALAHARQHLNLSQKAVSLAGEIVENINLRLDKGAALQSELLLARLEEQRALMDIDQAKQTVKVMETNLASLWGGKTADFQIAIDNEPNFTPLLEGLKNLTSLADSTREIIQMQNEVNLLRTERELVSAEARPVFTFSSGIKRLEAEKSKSFLFGLSIPIPLFNRNQGERWRLDSQMQALEYDMKQSRLEILSVIQSHKIQLGQLLSRHSMLDSLLLPIADQAYQTLQNAYKAGRVPYTQLLEAERMLNELNYEHNDIILEIQEELIKFERLSGIILRTEKENQQCLRN